jgi:hypothetical protein
MLGTSRRKRLIVGAFTLLVLAAVGAVYAAWTVNGTGDAYAKAKGAPTALTTVNVSATTPATLYPGATGDVLIRIKNDNDYQVRVTTITGNGAITPDAGHSSCNAAASVTFDNQTGKTIDVPGGGGETEVTLSGAAHMSNAANDACQGATFTVPVSLSGQSNP